ncbi:MAG: dTDP-4-dehydrorhamnose 3,5-epimerase [Kofleriaceae bacterium]
MKIIPTSLPGLLLFEPTVYEDARGTFMETFHRQRYREAGVDFELVQENLSTSYRGVLRGLHFQLHRPQGKLTQCTSGAIYDVGVDIRRGSPTFGAWFGTILSAENHRQLWIPPGFAHGFLAMSDRAEVVYRCTDLYSPTDERTVRWNDPQLGIAWPLDGEPLLSKRDAIAPLVADAELPMFDS